MLRNKSREEVCCELGVSIRTFRRELKRRGIYPPKYKPLSPCWQKVIYDAFFWPSDVDKADYVDVGPPKDIEKYAED